MCGTLIRQASSRSTQAGRPVMTGLRPEEPSWKELLDDVGVVAVLLDCGWPELWLEERPTRKPFSEEQEPRRCGSGEVHNSEEYWD